MKGVQCITQATVYGIRGSKSVPSSAFRITNLHRKDDPLNYKTDLHKNGHRWFEQATNLAASSAAASLALASLYPLIAATKGIEVPSPRKKKESGGR